MPSVIRGSDNFDTAGGNAVKAWVNFNGTGTVAIRASFNVSSITDNGTGNYTLNLTNPLADTNYAGVGGGTRFGSLMFPTQIEVLTTSTAKVYSFDGSTSADIANITAAIFR